MWKRMVQMFGSGKPKPKVVVKLPEVVAGMDERTLVRCFETAPHQACWPGVQQVLAEEQQELLNLAVDPAQPAEVVKCYMVAFGRVTAVRNQLDSLHEEAKKLAQAQARQGKGV